MFAFGLFATDIFVNAGQVVTGNLAPYFLTVCKPNYTGNDCRAHHEFINNGNICTGDVEVIEKARRSFPSKHAALSIYSALYATVSASDNCYLVWEVSVCASRRGHFSHNGFLKKKGCFGEDFLVYLQEKIPFSLCFTNPSISKSNAHCFCGTVWCRNMRS